MGGGSKRRQYISKSVDLGCSFRRVPSKLRYILLQYLLHKIGDLGDLGDFQLHSSRHKNVHE